MTKCLILSQIYNGVLGPPLGYSSSVQQNKQHEAFFCRPPDLAMGIEPRGLHHKPPPGPWKPVVQNNFIVSDRSWWLKFFR